MNATAGRVANPPHVPPELIVDFDMYHIPGADDDVQMSYRSFQQGLPDIFWTPFNGGHWVATRAADIESISLDFERFSSRRIVIPKMPPEVPLRIPVELDPPRHIDYRRPLMRGLTPAIVNALETKVADITIGLIEGFKDRGQCEFMSEFASIVPIHVFLDLVDLPREDRSFLLPLTEDTLRGGTVEVRMAANRALADYLSAPIRQRREKPGKDLLSQIVNVQINGETISVAEATSFATLVLFGGLDTVASVFGFVARFLAMSPSHRHELIARLDDDTFMRGAIEELLRRHGVANTARYIAKDCEYKGLSFREGDMILPPNLLVGLDDRRVDDPLTVNFSRPLPISHAAFGYGPHTCPGAGLARRELKIFLTEWLRRIPNFEIRRGTTPVVATGVVNGVLRLELTWPSTIT